MYATLLLVQLTLRCAPTNEVKGFLVPLYTDNQGNAYATLATKAKTWPTAAFLMSLVYSAYTVGVHLKVYHTKREFNQWADDLSNAKTADFDPMKQVPAPILADSAPLLKKLLTVGSEA